MQHIDEPRLETDVAYRFGYLTQFMNVTADDLATIAAAGSHLAPLVPGLVDAVYDKLSQYDATWRHFAKRNAGFDGPVAGSPDKLRMEDPQIAFRKAHLARYLAALVTRTYDDKMVMYLDMVGKMHTPKAGSADLDVPLVQMNALLGFVADALTATIFALNLDRETEMKTVRAFQKLLWVQNDLINRHYQASPSETHLPQGATSEPLSHLAS